MHLFHVLLTSGCVPAQCVQCFCQSVKKTNKQKTLLRKKQSQSMFELCSNSFSQGILNLDFSC